MTAKTTPGWVDLIVNHAKTIISFVIFACGLYIQHEVSMMRIEHMEKEIVQLKVKVDDQYVKLDNMKLDKAVFEATIQQFTEMSTDIRQIRDRLEDMMESNGRYHNNFNK